MPPLEFVDRVLMRENLASLEETMNKIPAVKILSSSINLRGYWWVKLDIDIQHRLAWNVVQELGFVLNEISLTEKLPTLFMPVSPPPYLNGGPEECLSWVIESKLPYVHPLYIQNAILERLPCPLENESVWGFESADDEV